MGACVRRCSAPSCSMMCVPEATTLPIVPRPISASNRSIRSRGKPCGNVGNARSSTIPVISQWPVTESLPGERSAMRPNAAVGCVVGGMPGRGAMHPSPRACSVGVCTATCRHMFPSVSLPSSPYEPASGRAPTPAPSSTSTIARLRGGGVTPVARCASALRGQVVPCRSRAPDARDGVFEQHLVGAGLIDDQREAVEVPDPPLEFLTVHQADRHDEPLAAGGGGGGGPHHSP